MPSTHTFINSPSPQLPNITHPLPITHTRTHRKNCGPEYLIACLELAQSLYRSGYPAQAILQLDKSFMANNINKTIIYKAIIWIIQNAPDNQFLGNPVRHFQHLATRMNMNQPNANRRIWQAWACLHLTEKHSKKQHPRDNHQITTENLTIPTIKITLKQMDNLVNSQESQALRKLLS